MSRHFDSSDSFDCSPAPLYRAAGLRRLEAAAADQPLMQRAGLAAADLAGELTRDSQSPILILAGPGNNGGDGFEAARLLRQRGHDICLVFTGDAARLPTDAAAARERFLSEGGNTADEIPQGLRWGLIIDALFGIGLQRPLQGIHAELVAAANRLAAECNCPLLALDCPSGLDADTGCVRGTAICATHTITFIAGKPGLLTNEGPDHCGLLQTAPLALDAPGMIAAEGASLGRADFVDFLQLRRRNSHKGSNGSAGILGGAPGMVGAAFLAGRAALQLGSGRVYVGLIEPGTPAFDPGQPELMLRNAAQLLTTQLSALACGPGLGAEPLRTQLVEAAAALPVPLLLDADAINLLAAEGNLKIAVATRHAPTLLTPHPAEAARLLGTDTAAVQADRIAAAIEIAGQFNAHVALKGCGTVLATPQGEWRINTTGNPGMGSAGMGDVLSGIVVALIAQGWPAQAALAGGVHLHGAAADLLAAEQGEIGIAAGETIAAARYLLNRWIHPDD